MTASHDRISWLRTGAVAALAVVLVACEETGQSQAQGTRPPPAVTVANPLVQEITE